MQQRLLDSWPAFANAHLLPSPTSIRVNPKKNHAWYKERIPWTDNGYYLNERPVFTLDPAFHAGAYYVQEASSMFLEHVVKQCVDLSQPLRVLDLCAAPGGKSTLLLSLLNEDSLLVTNEVIRSRTSILSENIQKWGHSNVIVTNNDPEHFKKLNGFFDVIVVDAPCSGEGLFRKDSEAMAEWSPDNVALCAQRQRRILSHVWPALRENGIIIYCTCTYSEEENEENLRWMKEQHHAESIEIPLDPSWGIEKITREGVAGYRFYPHRVTGEGFFIAALRKTSEGPALRIKAKKKFMPASKKLVTQLRDWLLKPDSFEFIQQENLVIQIPSSMYEAAEFIAEQLHVVNKGTAVAEVKHEKLIPEHAFALCVELNANHFKQLELTYEQVLSYLRRDNLMIGENEKGFALITFEGNPMGWVNLLGNRVNNLYPSSWRIRMGS